MAPFADPQVEKLNKVISQQYQKDQIETIVSNCRKSEEQWQEELVELLKEPASQKSIAKVMQHCKVQRTPHKGDLMTVMPRPEHQPKCDTTVYVSSDLPENDGKKMHCLHFNRDYGPVSDVRVVQIESKAAIMVKLPYSAFIQHRPAHYGTAPECIEGWVVYCMPNFQFLDVVGDTQDLMKEDICDIDSLVHRRQFFVASLSDESVDDELDNQRVWEYEPQQTIKMDR